MKKKRPLYLIFFLIACISLSSCSNNRPIDANYSFETAQDVTHTVDQFEQVKFTSDNNLDLGFYEGEVWIKLDITNGTSPSSFVVLCNDLINHNYRFYTLDSLKKTFVPKETGLDLSKYDHRSFRHAKPNFRIDLTPNESNTYLITTKSDGRILQATPELIHIDDFHTRKQATFSFDVLFYASMFLILLINLFYFRLIRNDIYYYYGAYILFGCLTYLFVEGRFYGLGMSKLTVDHLIFISIRLWVLSSTLFTLNFLQTKITHYRYYRLIIFLLTITLGGTTVYQLLFPYSSISNLHRFENIVGLVWVILSLSVVAIAYQKRKVQTIYYIIAYSAFLLCAALGLIDSHATILPGDPFSYIKLGTILEFIGFTYFISVMVKRKLANNSTLEEELSKSRNELEEKEKLLASKDANLASIFKLIENSFSNESDWNNFKSNFEKHAPNFLENLLLEHPDLTKSEIRLLTLIRLGYSQKEIANILNIAPDSVKKARSRVRKKLKIEESETLTAYIQQF